METGGLLTWSPNENQFAVIATDGNQILVKDSASGELVTNFFISGRPYVIHFSPDGKYIANLSDFWIEVWSLESGGNIVNIDFDTLNPDESHYGIASGLAWRPDSTKLAFVYDYKVGILDLATKEVTNNPSRET